MNRLLCFSFGLLLLTGCASDDRTPLVIYSPHGKELLSAYEEAFEAQHPEVDVQWLDMGSQQVYERILTERVNPQASVWWGSPQTLFMQAAAESLLVAFEPSWADSVSADAHDPNGYWYGTFLTPEGFLYNREAVDSTDAPSDWEDILDPRWKDRLLIRSPLESGTMRSIWGAIILRQPTVQEGYKWLARLDMNTKSYAADPTQLYLRIARGEADVTLWNLPDTYLQAQAYPFAFAAPNSGAPVLVDGIAIPAGAPQEGLAKQFIEFVTSKDALIDQARRFHRIPARTDIPPDSLPDWMGMTAFTPMPLDWARMTADGPEWMQVWDEKIKGRGAQYLAENP